jgi:hypothetical protein
MSRRPTAGTQPNAKQKRRPETQAALHLEALFLLCTGDTSLGMGQDG